MRFGVNIEESAPPAARTRGAARSVAHRRMEALTRELVERAATGDEQAFESLARLSSNRLFAIAWRILRDHHLAEDAVQQTLVTIWDELPRLRDPDRFEAWTYRLVVRAAMAEARRGRRGALV
jgi:DNA-directed RNA polymerase specialized sigma24 family protein